MKHIEQLLRQTIGLEAASIGSGLIERAVRLRMNSHGLKKVEDYERLIESSPAERDELAESVIVTETWFFRDYEPFAALVRLILEQWLPQHPYGQLRLLSFPCSSGEEPYSLAMALLSGGFCAQRLEIDAVDISARALARAQGVSMGETHFAAKSFSSATNTFNQRATVSFSMSEFAVVFASIKPTC